MVHLPACCLLCRYVWHQCGRCEMDNFIGLPGQMLPILSHTMEVCRICRRSVCCICPNLCFAFVSLCYRTLWAQNIALILSTVSEQMRPFDHHSNQKMYLRVQRSGLRPKVALFGQIIGAKMHACTAVHKTGKIRKPYFRWRAIYFGGQFRILVAEIMTTLHGAGERERALHAKKQSRSAFYLPVKLMELRIFGEFVPSVG